MNHGAERRILRLERQYTPRRPAVWVIEEGEALPPAARPDDVVAVIPSWCPPLSADCLARMSEAVT